MYRDAWKTEARLNLTPFFFPVPVADSAQGLEEQVEGSPWHPDGLHISFRVC